MNKVEHEWQRTNKIGNEKEVSSVKGYPFYLQNSFSKKNWDSTFSKTEEPYFWNLSKCSCRLPMRLGIGLN